jgi:hypothetical protein
MIIVAKGKNVVRFEADARTGSDCVDAMLGPTGNLRAPTLVIGKTVLVGFDEASYRTAFG